MTTLAMPYLSGTMTIEKRRIQIEKPEIDLGPRPSEQAPTAKDIHLFLKAMLLLAYLFAGAGLYLIWTAR